MTPETPFFDKVETLRTTIQHHGGQPSALSELKDLLEDADVRRQFFVELDSPEWIRPLDVEGYFDSPPAATLDAEAVGRGAVWPASEYLARMAGEAPEEVAEVFAECETDNVAVIGDMIDAALAMPVFVATTVVDTISCAGQRGLLWPHIKDASEFCVQLAEQGEGSAAVDLADALFATECAEEPSKSGRRDVRWSRTALADIVPVLARKRPGEFLPMICDWLETAIDAKDCVDPDSGRDESHRWRPAIEEHDQNREYDLAGVITGFVREGFEETIRAEQLSVNEALAILDSYQYLVFKRIRLHLLAAFGDRTPKLARRAMMNRDLFDDYRYKHEYAMLVRRRLDLLTENERDEWFGWIEAGPDVSDDEDVAEQERRERKRYWQFVRLHWVREHLEGKRQEFYEEMLEEHGEPELSDLNFRTEVWRWGRESPWTVEHLNEVSFEEAVERVSSWEPSEDQFMGPNMEGLGSTFEQYVAGDREAFSSQANVLIGRPAIFVRGFIHQMAAAAKAGSEIDILAVLELCHWVIGQPADEQTTPDHGDGALVDKDWRWTRDEIAQFIKNVCVAREDSAPRYSHKPFRESMWRILSALSRDPAESYVVRDASEEDPRVHDYLNMAINSPRGKAVEAALEYARWVACHVMRVEDGEEKVPDGFEAMPEVREMLEYQIAPVNRSVAAMAVIGSRAGLLDWIDREWLGVNANRIFDLETSDGSVGPIEGWAAWNAFLVWGRPNIRYYRLLEEQFARAVSQSSQVELPDEDIEGQPMKKLGEHLMLLYGRGQLGLDDDGGLLGQFMSEANGEIRRHAVSFVGQSLEGDQEIPEDVISRFQELWELYWADEGRTDAQESQDGWLFGTWFDCGQFPDRWALEQLEEFVEIVPTPQPSHEIAERLAEVADADIARAVRILDQVIRADQEGWLTYEWRDPAMQILETAMLADGDARRTAERLIDHLGRRGYSEFGALLNVENDA